MQMLSLNFSCYQMNHWRLGALVAETTGIAIKAELENVFKNVFIEICCFFFLLVNVILYLIHVSHKPVGYKLSRIRSIFSLPLFLHYRPL